MTPLDPARLEPGDTLLYRPTGFSWRRPMGWVFGKLIAAKTWHNISHVEVYAGNAWWQPTAAHGAPFSGRASFASRDGLGVDVYPLRLSELAYVLRPPARGVDLMAANRWFLTVQGQGYDWVGLTRFVRTSITQSPTKMFCSAFWLRLYRAGGFNPFSAHVDADSIAPGEILNAPGLTVIWTDGLDDKEPIDHAA